MAGPVKPPPDPHAGIKRALLLIVIGLIVQLFCLNHITPNTFMIFATLGVGPVFVGLVIFIVEGVRERRRARTPQKGAASDAS